MKQLLGLALTLGTLWPSKADGWILFQNSTSTPVYQANGTIVTRPFVAQLYQQKEDWVPISQPVTVGAFRAGLFAGGKVVISGDYGGKTVTLLVRVWDGSRFSSYDQAVQMLSATGESQPFTETLAASPDGQAKPLTNFSSFWLNWDDSGHLVPSSINSELVIEEGQSVHVDYPSYSFWDLRSIIGYCNNPIHPIPDYLPGLSLGALRGVVYPNPYGQGPQELNPYTYVPNPHTYGTDLIYYPTGATEFSEGPTRSGAIAITIHPSAARNGPTLFLSAPMKPALLGLNARQYRIERSSDLNTWEAAGTVTGNSSTVDLSSFVNAGANAHFLRATDVTAP
ncbi:MAG TPA: hypothetical protein VMB21_12005 [Candidatus Limnocylindria bacterium]|nr:hypothetical protein [Candidatus Limnocylindria bacterium]